jgi:hypothetical protein
MLENWKEFRTEIEKLSLSELEEMIKKLYKGYPNKSTPKYDKLETCLSYRKNLINHNFKFTPEAVRHIARVNTMFMEARAKVLSRCCLLYRQMLQLMQQGDDFVDEFEVEGSVTINFRDEDTVVILMEDENNGQSDYAAMSDALEYTQTDSMRHTSGFSFCSYDNADLHVYDEKLGFIDSTSNVNWNFEQLNAPELSGIKYFCYDSHSLFCDSDYSFSDAIRIKDVRCEVIVTHTHLGYSVKTTD